MNKSLLIILFTLGLIQLIGAQNSTDILIIDSKYDISISNEKFVKEIHIKRGLIKKNKYVLNKQCVDSTRFYNGNCFKITYYNENDFVTLKKGKITNDYIVGKIYSLNENEIQKIRSEIENYQYLKSNSLQTDNSKHSTDSAKIIYEANFVFQYGGESKLALFLPKVNLLRKHRFDFISPYYGIELGLHAGLVSAYGSFSGIVGLEKDIFSFETSASHFWTTKISDGNNGFNGPFNQNLVNLKLGFQIKKVKLKVGTSFLINEHIPLGQTRIPLLDIGKINKMMYGIELQFNIDRW